MYMYAAIRVYTQGYSQTAEVTMEAIKLGYTLQIQSESH